MSKEIVEIEKVLKLVYSGNFSANDIQVLFVNMRRHVKGDDLLYDLCNFMAHPETRNQGNAHSLITKFVNNVINVSKFGGSIGPKPIRESLIYERCAATLNKLLPNFNSALFKAQKRQIIDFVYEKLDGIEMEFSKPEIDKCMIKLADGKLYFALNMNISGQWFKISQGATMQMILFE